MRKEDFQVSISSVRLRGWVIIPRKASSHPLVVLCHGIPGSVPVEGDPGYEGLASELARNGLATLFFNFRGTGFSSGNFSLRGWMEDLGRIMRLVFEERDFLPSLDRERVVLWGYSAGGAVAITYAAKDRRPCAVISMSSPDSFARLFPPEQVGLLIQHCRTVGIIKDVDYPQDERRFFEDLLEFSPVGYVGEISPRPLLLVHGSHDETVPVESSQRLYEMAREPRELVIIEKGQHKLRLNHQATEIALSWLVEQNILERRG